MYMPCTVLGALLINSVLAHISPTWLEQYYRIRSIVVVLFSPSWFAKVPGLQASGMAVYSDNRQKKMAAVVPLDV